jgi:AraC-like DNA-binding protein
MTNDNSICTIKIQKALPILLNKSYNISEVAFEVGYNGPKYFTKCFRKKLGITPTEYSEFGSRDLNNNSIFEERFIADLARVVEDDLANNFNSLDVFASRQNVSKSTLYRRIKTLTGM